MTDIAWDKSSVERTEELVEQESATVKRKAKQKTVAKKLRQESLQTLERKRDEHGRWLRTGTVTGKAHTLTVRVPRVLMEKIIAEADDVDYGHAKMLVVMAQLGLPIWQKYRGELMLEREPEYVPAIVKAIVQQALNSKAPSFIHKKWKGDVEKELNKEAERLRKQREKKLIDPTERALKHFGE